MWKEIWMTTIAVTVLIESSITSEPVIYWSNTGKYDSNFQNMHSYVSIQLCKKYIKAVTVVNN